MYERSGKINGFPRRNGNGFTSRSTQPSLYLWGKKNAVYLSLAAFFLCWLLMYYYITGPSDYDESAVPRLQTDIRVQRTTWGGSGGASPEDKRLQDKGPAFLDWDSEADEPEDFVDETTEQQELEEILRMVAKTAVEGDENEDAGGHYESFWGKLSLSDGDDEESENKASGPKPVGHQVEFDGELTMSDLVEDRWFDSAWSEEAGNDTFSDEGEPIPKILHFTWRTANEEQLPELFRKIQVKWRKLNPDWEIKIWTDEDAEQLVKDYYPELYFFYSDFQVTAERSDIFRYLALDKFGGYYADMDIEPLKSLDDLLNITGNPGCILALEPEVHAIMIYNKYHMIGNAFMASRPGHALWRWLIPQTIKRYYLDRNPKDEKDATKITGPVTVDSVVQKNPEMSRDCVLLQPDVTAPAYDVEQHMYEKCTNILDSSNLQFTDFEDNPYVRICEEVVSVGDMNKDYPPNSFMVHHWAHTWTAKGENSYKNGTDYAETNTGLDVQELA